MESSKVLRKCSWTLSNVLLAVGALIMLMPFLWMFLSSFKTLAEIQSIPIKWLPKRFSLDNYIQVLSRWNFGRYYLNTIIVTVAVTAGQLFVNSLAAYSFAKLRFWGRDAIFFVYLTMLMVPVQMVLLPNYILLSNFKWIDTLWALIIPNIHSIYGVFLLRQFFRSIPKEMDDAAKIDGCSYIRTYWSIMIPLCSNALIAYAVFTILWIWNDLLWPLIMVNSETNRVLSVSIAILQGQYINQYHYIMAASVMATLPMIIVFLLGQKNLVSGIVITGIKG